MIHDADNSLFITRRANLISVIHEHSKKCGMLASDGKVAQFSGDSTSSLLQEALWQKQLAQQQIQISSLQFQLEEQIAHLRMAAGINFCSRVVSLQSSCLILLLFRKRDAKKNYSHFSKGARRNN